MLCFYFAVVVNEYCKIFSALFSFLFPMMTRGLATCCYTFSMFLYLGSLFPCANGRWTHERDDSENISVVLDFDTSLSISSGFLLLSLLYFCFS